MNIRKIIVPEIPLPIKDRETFVLDNLRIISTITSMLIEQPPIQNFCKLSNFTNKCSKDGRTTDIDGGKVLTEVKDVLKKFKDHFEKIIEILKIDRPIFHLWFRFKCY